MIRVTIEKITYMLIDPKGESEAVVQYTDMRPQVTGPAIVSEASRTLLLQEVEDLHIGPIVAYLNGLQTPSVCSCGHPKHRGRCTVYMDERLGYSGKRCECTDYRTPEQSKADKVGEALLQSECTLASTETKLEAAQDEIEQLTSRHENLLKRRGKTGGKKR